MISKGKKRRKIGRGQHSGMTELQYDKALGLMSGDSWWNASGHGWAAFQGRPLWSLASLTFLPWNFHFLIYLSICFPGGTSGKEVTRQWHRIPLAGKIPWGSEWLLTPAFLPGESHGQRSLAGCSPCPWISISSLIFLVRSCFMNKPNWNGNTSQNTFREKFFHDTLSFMVSFKILIISK